MNVIESAGKSLTAGKPRSALKMGVRFLRKRLGPAWHSNWWRFLILVLTPTLAVFLYTALLSTPMYISHAMFSINNPDRAASAVDLASIFLSSSSVSITAESHLVTAYIHSWDMITKVDQGLRKIDPEGLGLRELFSDRRYDFISRLAHDSSQKELQDYWRWLVNVNFESDTGIITCGVKAYSPEIARRINLLIIELSEALVNDMNERSHRDALRMGGAEVEIAEQRLASAQESLRALRERTTILDPKSTAESIYAVISRLELEVSTVEAQLSEARAYMHEDSPLVLNLKRRLEALTAQLDLEKTKRVSGGDPAAESNLTRFSDVAGEFESALLAEEFARNQYVMAMSALEGARIRAEAKKLYLVAFEPPVLPDESLYPDIPRFTLLTFLWAAFSIAIISLLVAAVREHVGF